MGLFGKIFGSGQDKPPSPPGAPSPPPPERRGSFKSGEVPEEYGALLTDGQAQAGPFPKTMKLRAGMTDYDLYGSWQMLTWNSPEEFGPVKDQVINAYYKQFGIYRLPGDSETIRWNELTWREVRNKLQILYDPKFGASGAAR